MAENSDASFDSGSLLDLRAEPVTDAAQLRVAKLIYMAGLRHHLMILYGCGDFITDYEGIAGYETFRDDLVLMYLPALRTSDGMLARLTMIPYQLRRFRLNRAAQQDAEWLRDVLDRESRRFNTCVTLDKSGCLQLEWS